MVDSVIKYIIKQKEHHNKIKFRNEYISLLEKFNIPFDEKYLFEWIN